MKNFVILAALLATTVTLAVLPAQANSTTSGKPDMQHMMTPEQKTMHKEVWADGKMTQEEAQKMHPNHAAMKAKRDAAWADGAITQEEAKSLRADCKKMHPNKPQRQMTAEQKAMHKEIWADGKMTQEEAQRMNPNRTAMKAKRDAAWADGSMTREEARSLREARRNNH